MATGTIRAFLGHDVTMAEKDADKVATLQAGRSPRIDDRMETRVTWPKLLQSSYSQSFT